MPDNKNNKKAKSISVIDKAQKQFNLRAKPTNFFSHYDSIKVKIKKFNSALHIGSAKTIKRSIKDKTKRNTITIKFEEKNINPPTIIEYFDIHGNKLATLSYDNSGNCYLKCLQPNIEHINFICDKGLQANSFYFDNSKINLNLSGKLKLADDLFIYANEIKISDKAEVNVNRSVLNATSLINNGNYTSNDTLLVTHDQLINNESFKVNERFDAQVTEFVNNGDIEVNNDHIVNCTTYLNDAKATLKTKALSHIHAKQNYTNNGHIVSEGFDHVDADRINLNGVTDLNEARYHAKKRIDIHQGAQVNYANMCLLESENVIRHKGNVTQSNALEKIISNALSDEQKGHLILSAENIYLDRQSNISNQSNANETIIHATHNVHCNSAIDAEKLNINSEKVALKKHAHLNTTQNIIDADTIISNGCIVTEGGHMHANNALLLDEGSTIKNTGKLSLNGKSLKFAGLYNPSFNADNLSNDHCEIAGEEVSITATVNSNDFYINQAKNVVLTPESNIAVNQLKFDNVTHTNLQGNVTSKKTIVLNADGVITEDSAQIIADETISVKANHIELNLSKVASKDAIQIDCNKITAHVGNELSAGKIIINGDVVLLDNIINSDKCDVTARSDAKCRPFFLGNIQEFNLNGAKVYFAGKLGSVNRFIVKSNESFELAHSGFVLFKEIFYVENKAKININGRVCNDTTYAEKFKELNNKPSAPFGFMMLIAPNIILNNINDCLSAKFCANSFHVTSKAELTASEHIIVDADRTKIDGAVRSSNIMYFKGHEVQMAKESIATAKNAFEIHSKDLIIDGAVVDSEVLNFKVDNLTVDHRSRISGKKAYLSGQSQQKDARGKLYKISKGTIKTGTLVVKCGSWFHRDGSLDADTASFDCYNYFVDVIYNTRVIHLLIDDKAEVAQNAMITGKDSLICQGGKLENRGRMTTHAVMKIDMRSTTNHQTGHMIQYADSSNNNTNDKKITPLFTITGDCFWTTGEIRAEKSDIVVKLNRTFIFGYSEFSSLREATTGSISTYMESVKRIDILAAATVCVGGSMKADEISSIALLNLIFTLARTNNFKTQGILSLNAGGIVPNLTKASKFFRDVANGDFKTDSIFTRENALTALNLSVTALKFVTPLVGNGVGIAKDVVMFAVALPDIIKSCQQLHKIGIRNLQFRDVIPTLIKIKSAALQVTGISSAVKNMGNNFFDEQGNLIIPEAEINLDHETLIKSAETIAVTFLPGVSDESIISIAPLRLVLTGHHETKSVIGVEAGVDVAVVVTSEFVTAVRLSETYAHATRIEGQDLLLGGSIKSDQTYINLQKLTTINDITLTHASINVQKHIVPEGQKVTLEESLYNAKTTENSGHFVANNSVIKSEKTFTNDENAQLELNQTDAQMHDVYLEGKTEVTDTRISFNELKVPDQGKLHLKESFLKGNNWNNEGEKKKTDDVTSDNPAPTRNSDQNETTVSFDGDITSTDSVVCADDIKFSATCKTEVNNSGFNAVNIAFASNAKVVNTFSLHAINNINTTEASCIQSGDQEATVVLDSQGGDLKGLVKADYIFIKNNAITPADFNDLFTGTGKYQNIQAMQEFAFVTDKEIKITDSFDGKIGLSLTAQSIDIEATMHSAGSLSFESTKGDVSVNANVEAAENLIIKSAANIKTNNSHFTGNQTTYFDAKDSFTNYGGYVTGSETFINALHDISNIGGNIKGSVYLQLDGENIYNTCVQTPYKGKYDTMISYKPGQFQGGTGEGYDGAGIVVHASNKVYNTASIISAEGDVYVHGEHGVESKLLTHEFVSYKKTSGNFLHKRKKVYVDTQVEKPVFASENSRVVISTNDGNIELVSADIASKHGADIYAQKGKISILDAIITRRIIKEDSKLGGLSKHKHKETHESSVPTTIANIDPGYTRIHTEEKGDIEMRGTQIIAPGEVSITAADNVAITNSILHHTIEEKSSGIGLSVFGFNLFGNNGKSSPFLNADPTYEHMKTLFESQGADEVVLNTVNAVQDLTNTVNQIGTAIDNGNVLSALKDRYIGSMKPSIELSWNTHKSRYDYETLGDGMIATGDLTISGKNATVEGVPLYVAHDLKVNVADTFKLQGVALQSHYSSKDTSSSLTFRPQSILKPDFGFSESKNNMDSVFYAQQQVYVGNEMTVEANKWEMIDSNVDVGSIKGKVDVLTLVSHPNLTQGKATSFSVNTNGNVAFNTMHNDSALLPNPTELHVREDLTTQFKIEDVKLTGAKITSEGTVDLGDAKITVFDVNTYSHKSSHGTSFNAYQIFNALLNKPTNDYSIYQHTLNPESQLANKKLATANISQISESIESKQHSVIYGNKGTQIGNKIEGDLHTTSGDGSEIIHQESHHRIAEIPLLTEKNINLFKEAFDRVTGEHSNEAPNRLFNKIAELTGIKDKTKAADEIKKLHSLASNIYKSDLGKEDASKQGLTLFKSYEETTTSTHIAIFVDEETNKAYIVARGTDGWNALATDCVDILQGDPLRSVENNAEFSKFMDDAIAELEKDGYNDILITGHSRGATQASVISSEYGLPAFVFDNPGVNVDGGYDMELVLSFQSSPNLVNAFPKLNLSGYDFGTVWLMQETYKDTMKNVLFSTLSQNSIFVVPGASLDLLSSHSIKNIGDRLPFDKSKLEFPKEYHNAPKPKPHLTLFDKSRLKQPCTLDETAAHYGFKVNETKEGVWSFFHAVKQELQYNEYSPYKRFTPIQLARTAVQHFQKINVKSSVKIKKDFDKYCNDLMREQIAPNEEIINALSHELGLKIVVIHGEGMKPSIFGVNNDKSTIYLGQDTNGHYHRLTAMDKNAHNDIRFNIAEQINRERRVTTKN